MSRSADDPPAGGSGRRFDGREDLERFFEVSVELFAIVSGKNLTWLRVNPAFERMLGWSHNELGGRRLLDLVHPDDLARTRAAVRAVAAGGTLVDFENRLERRDGGHVRISWSAGPSTPQDQIHLVGREVTLQRESGQAGRDDEALLATLIRHTPIGIGLFDADGRRLLGNAPLNTLVGDRVPSADPTQHGRWLSIGSDGEPLPPDQWPGARALRGETVSPGIDFRTDVDGRWRWLRISAAPVRTANGGARQFVVLTEDITEAREAEEHRALLLRELNHRVKNTLAVVQAIARQTFSDVPGAEEGLHRFAGRLGALSQAHALLTDAQWDSARLAEIVEFSARTCARERFDISGPDITLPPQAAVSIAMALHELCTNALKYGALKAPDGRIGVHWTLTGDDTPRLNLEWRESGGPPVKPPGRRGFGSRMVEQALAGELDGAVSMDFAPSGLVCQISAPLPGVDEEARQRNFL